MFIMNAQILLFTIAISSNFAIGSNTDNKVTNYDHITLSKKSMENLDTIYGTSDSPVKKHAIGMALQLKRKDQKLNDKDQQLNDQHQTISDQNQKLNDKDTKIKTLEEKMFLNFFLCAITTSKADTNTAKNDYNIFKKPYLREEQKLIYYTLELPENIRDLMLHHDGKPPKNKKIEDHVRYHTTNFRNLYFNLNRTENRFYNRLRRELNDKHAKNSNVNITEVYISFAATIVRDYAFFCGEHHSSLAELLENINDHPEKNVLDILFGTNSNWYLNGTHIEHMNILRNAVHLKNLVPIFGYKCKNADGNDIEVPLYDKCGREAGFTVRPDFLN